jgi:hypothetical protein
MDNKIHKNKQLTLIKKTYGEKFSQLCRDLFPNLIESEVLYDLLTARFQAHKELYNDIIKEDKISEFKDYIYSSVDVERLEKEKGKVENPFDLMLKAGYNLFECTTEDEIKSFKRYYKDGESLCTFNTNRLKTCHVFFAVKTDVGDIKREDFSEPKRQDEYGTSVISIQFSRGTTSHLSIKNRYNHKVNNCDSTFNNNLDNIIEGLTESFRVAYGFNFKVGKSDFELDNYVIVEGKAYKYNYEIDDVYYCVNNTTITAGVVTEYNRNEYLLIDCYLLDLKLKEIKLQGDITVRDSFIGCFENITKIGITVDRGTRTKVIRIWCREQSTVIDNKTRENTKLWTEKERAVITVKEGVIIGLKLSNIEEIDDYFMCHNKNLEKFECDSVGKIGHRFMHGNVKMKEFKCSNLREIGNYHMGSNTELEEFDCESLEIIGKGCLTRNRRLKKFNCPKLRVIEGQFLIWNKVLEEFNCESLLSMGKQCMEENRSLKKFNCPKLKEIGEWFMPRNTVLEEFNCESLEIVGSCLMFDNNSLKSINCSNLKGMESYFLHNNEKIEEFDCSNLNKIGHEVFFSNRKIRLQTEERMSIISALEGSKV